MPTILDKITSLYSRGPLGRRAKKSRKSRVCSLERLEQRRVLAAAIWHNARFPVDVSNDQPALVTPLDVLLIINHLNDAQRAGTSGGLLPRQVDTPGASDFVDVSCDGRATPLDVLRVINYLNEFGNGTEGGFASDGGIYENAACSPQLLEGDHFVDQMTQVLRVPADKSALQVTFQSPEFDTASRGQIRDAFEIEITDAAGERLALPYQPGRDAVYNWTEALEPLYAAGTWTTTGAAGETSSFTIDLSHLDASSEVHVSVRLVNNDSDNNTSVLIRGFEFVEVPAGGPSTPLRTAASEAAEVTPFDFNLLSDLTGSVSANYGGTSLRGENNELFSEFRLTNNGSRAVMGPLIVALDNFSELDANLMHPDGFLLDGRPFFDLTTAMDGRPLAQGESLSSRAIRFLNNSGLRFTYNLSVYGSLNAAPSHFGSIPLDSIEAGKTYSYQAHAIDPEGQTLTYSILAGPEQMSIVGDTGVLTWQTATEDLGAHNITLAATDPFGLSVEQSFVIQVVESLQNRPPVFVSTPETEAIAGSGFEVSTVQAGENPVGVAVANIGLDDGTLVTINRGNQTLSQITALGNDRYELLLELTVGEPGPVDQILRSGYDIDVGLPRYINQSEWNSIRGMDQADLNGDGLLDIVISAHVHQRIPATVYTQVINVVFGEGDGKFSEPVNLASITTTNASNPRTLRLADFDQDGTIDILALNVNTSSLYLLRGTGDGNFSPVEVMPIATTLNDFKTVDLNQDGVLDLVGATSDTRSLGYMLGNGDGTFANFVAVVTVTNNLYFSTFPGRNYATSDMDGDGDIDIVYTHYSVGTVNVLTNDGSLNFTSAVSLPAPRPFGGSGTSLMYSVFVGDFNGDALVDIAYGAIGYTSNNTGSLGMFIRNSSGFTYTYQDGVDAIAHYPGNWAGNSDPVDIDGDGDLDLIVGSVTNSNFGEFASVLRNLGDGTFAANNISLPFTDNSDYEAINRENDTKGILAGDYNGDGMLDLIAFRSAVGFTQGSAYSTVSIVLADRPGEFASNDILHYDYSVNAPQRFFESGDFNNDGIVDLWSPRYQGVSRTWLGIGDGTFNDPIIATPAIGNEFLSKGFTGDFDKDGNLDIFWLGNGGIQNGPTSRLLAALGNGDGTFTRTFTLPYSHSEVLPADFNGDGYIDFAVRNFGTSLDVFLYDIENPGTWLLASTFAFSSLGTTAGDYRATLTVDDFNGDGKIDLAAAYRLSGGEPQIAVLPGVGDGSFGAPISTAYSVNIPDYNSPAQFTSGDLNEDGIADLVSYDSRAVGVHLGVGDGTFGTATVIPANDPREFYGNIFIKDFDYDGLQDILFTDTLGAAQLHFLRGRGDGTFEERISYDPAIPAGYVEFGDLDNDGRDEVILSDPNGTNFATILYAARERLTDIVTADLNGDGNDDVLATNFDNSRVKWFLGDNLGGLTKQPDLLTANGPVGLVVTDLDQDSTNEIITVNRSGRSVSIFSPDGTTFTRSDVSVGRTPIAVTAALVDADDHQDLLVLDEALNTVWYLIGNNDLTFAAPVPNVLGDRPNDLLAGDINGDSFTDIVVSLPDTNRLMILPGDGAGNFVAPTYIALPGSPTAIGISDFNQDGRADIAAAMGDSDEVLILYGRGQLQFASPQAIRVGDQPASLMIDDADGDGRDDIIVANRGDNTASVIFNRFDPTKVYRYDALAIDPDNDTVSYELIDAPGGMILDATTGQITWAPSAEQIGLQSVAIEATDGRGGAATQTFQIDVVPARENSAPLIGTLPNTTVSADEAFTYALSATDADRNPLRYRLIDGPDGATIDPITGLVTWDARQAAQRANEYSQVSQHIIVPATAALQPASVTVEGWFKFETPEGASETLLRKTNGFSGSSYQLSFQSGLLRATVGATTSSSTSVFVTHDLNREVGRWYHLAMTFDDSTKQLSLLVDGQQVATTTANLTLGYDDDTEILIAGTGTKLKGEVGSVRIWNVARSQALVQQSMSLPADAADPSLILDLDLNATEAQTLRDKSSYQHAAVRSGTGNIYSYRTMGLAYTQTAPFIVAVEDGRGGYDEQSFDVTYVLPLKGSISGTLFDDQSNDGIQQVGEAGLADWLVYADLNGNQYPDPSEPNAISDSNGRYAFSRLLPGNYPLRVQPRAGYETPAQSSANVVANQNSVVDFAIDELALGQIRGQVTTSDSDVAARWKVFADLDDNGFLDAADPFAFTDDLGNFAITGLDAGDYRVRAEMLPGWQVTDPTARVLDVNLAANAIAVENDFIVAPSNTTASSGLQFVTVPNLSGAGDSVIAGVTYRYDALAIGLLGQGVRYDFSLAPDGMSIDVATGLVLWRPSLAQVGEQSVILRAMDSLAGVSLQDFTLNVTAPNTAPTITSTAPSVGYVGTEARYSIQAQDAENDTLTYSLLTGPTNATVDSVSGNLTWTPAPSETGLNSFVVSVADTSGDVTLQPFDITVSSATPTTTPFALNPIRTQAAINQAYRSQVIVHDAIGRQLPVSIVSGPVGLTMDSEGNVTWTPATSQLGSQALVVTADDGLGNSQQFTTDLNVTGRLINTALQITSAPALFAVANQQYDYDVVAVDAENDQVAYQLLDAPVGMSINNVTGTLRWLPSRELVGEHTISIQVIDAAGASAIQSYRLRVRTAGGPPQITSVPPTEASVGTAWLYTVGATDIEHDPLTYSLLTRLEGLVIDSVTGELSWTPSANQLGLNAVAIQVSDGSGGSTSQSFAIRVSDGVPNLPPTINTEPNRFGSAGSVYSYLPSATDPEGQSIVYSLRRGPATMTVNPSTGQLDWTPTASDVGKVVVTLVATDAGGAAAVQSFELDVLAANQTPTIISSPSLSIAAGATWRYSVIGRDADLDPLRYELLEAPTGATITVFGEVQWLTSVGDIGPHAFRFRVSDPRGGVAEQSFTLDVVADTVAPRVTVLPATIGSWPWDGPIHVYVSAVDNVGVSSVTLTVNGIDVPLDANRHAALYVEDWGYAVLNIVATATDAAGNVGQGQGVTYYNDPEVDGDVNAPLAVITSPSESASVTGFVEIEGTAAGSNFSNYRLLYRRADQPESSFVEFATSTTAITDSVLGKWDTTLLNNDEYIIRLEVSNQSGRTNILDRQVGLSGDLKLGNFRLSFTDMVIPVAGIPIEITRIYDTLQADREGDFGYGWRLEYRNTDLRVGLPKSGLEDIGIYSALRPGVKVYLNVPGQGRQGFTFNPEIRVLPGFGDNLVVAQPRFTPDPGVTSTLSTGTSNYLFVNELGELFAPGQVPYNPASPSFGGAYVLTTQEGSSYRIAGVTGELNSATDRNGNTLKFSEAGIVYGDESLSVQFVRDAAGRITGITDPDGNMIKYDYSTNGDLVRVTDGEGNATKLTYSIEAAHYLEDVIDPLGRTGAKTDYDAQGRLVRIVDAQGNPIALASDPDNLVESITDAKGNKLTAEYDSRGNIIGQVDARGAITRRTFDTRNNLISETDPLGNTTTYTYDSRGNVTSVTDASGNRRTYTYGANGVILQQVDEIGAVTLNTLDAKGNVLSTTDSLGNVTTYTYDSKGNLLTETDALGNITQYAYDGAGNIVSETDALGHIRSYAYDARGNRLSETSSMTTSVGVVVVTTSWTYNSSSREISRTDALGNVSRTEYNAQGLESATIDENGNRTKYTYDERGQLLSTQYANGTSTSSTYDTNGRRLSTTDQLGRVTRFEYDAVGNQITTIYPDGTPDNPTDNPRTRNEYDLAGRRIAQIDELGNRREFQYNASGNVAAVILPDNTPNNSSDNLRSETVFDARGYRTATIDPASGRTEYVYNSAGQLLLTQFADGTSTRQEFDSLGRRIAEIDQNGIATHFEYDALDQLVAVVQTLDDSSASDPKTVYAYDEQGNFTTQTDANGNSTRYQHDVLSRRTGTTMALGQQSTTTYDAVGNVVSEVNFNGEQIDFTYDTLNRVVLRELPDNSSFAFTYTATGQRDTIVDGRGTTTYTYDTQDRVLSRMEPDGISIRYGYDLAGNEVSQTTPAGTVVKTYDELSRLTTVTDTEGGVTTYGYDNRGRLVETQYPNGVSDSLTLDVLSRILRIETQGPSGLIRSMDYTLDATGRRIRIAEASGRVVAYEYDSLYRLLAERIFDPTEGNRTIEFQYDLVGNRLLKLDSVEGTTSYAYDDNDRLLVESTAGVTTEYTYDANGNTLTKFTSANDRTTYRWNAENRLISATIVDASGTTEASYRYDADGLRVESTIDGETERSLLDKNRRYPEVVVEYLPSGETQASYTRGFQLISATRGDERAYYHANAIGTVRIMTGEGGDVVNSYVYDAFGNIIKQEIKFKNPFLFSGEFRDANLNLDFLRARYYDAVTGRFPTRDPFSGFQNDPFSLQRYTFVHNDPLNNTDPSGNGIGSAFIGGTLAAIRVGAIIGGIGLVGSWFIVGHVVRPAIVTYGSRTFESWVDGAILADLLMPKPGEWLYNPDTKKHSLYYDFLLEPFYDSLTKGNSLFVAPVAKTKAEELFVKLQKVKLRIDYYIECYAKHSNPASEKVACRDKAYEKYPAQFL